MTTPVWRNPLGNHLLRALPEPEYLHFESLLEFVTLDLGQILNEPFRGTPYGYFIVDGVVALLGRTEDGKSTGVAVIGSEGLVGVCLVLGDDTMPFEAIVMQAGHAFRLPLDTLRTEFVRGGRFQWTLLQFAKSLMCQIAQTAVCNCHHPVDRRLSKCLLFAVDRVPGQELELTHQFLSGILGLRREEVTLAAGRLQDAGLLQNARGRITILDKPGLERNACECYGAERSTFLRMYSHLFSR